MSERAVMKRRVRGLLHRKWLGPLAAIALAALPMAAFAVLAFFLTRSIDGDSPSLFAQIGEVFTRELDLQGIVVTLIYEFKPDFTRLISIAPILAMVAGAGLFIGLPIAVSFSGYFNGFLRGRQPKPWTVFSCFSGSYPRALFGMLYLLLWLILWVLMAAAMPVLLYMGGVALIEAFAEQLGLYQFYGLVALIILCILWFVVFAFVFINRLLAYSLTPVCVAAQPRLPAHRAVRLSRKLMRGNKWNMVGLILSCLAYFLPAIVCVAFLALFPTLVSTLGIMPMVQYYIRLCLLVVVGLNALLLFYVAPYIVACFHAFYIERKREALMDAEVTSDDFTAGPKREKPERRMKGEKSETPAISRRRRKQSSTPSEPYGASEVNIPAVSEPESNEENKRSEA